jgi:hypothetical protein
MGTAFSKSLTDDAVNWDLADAHRAVVNQQLSGEELGRYCEKIATPIEEWTKEILSYRNDATEY